MFSWHIEIILCRGISGNGFLNCNLSLFEPIIGLTCLLHMFCSQALQAGPFYIYTVQYLRRKRDLVVGNSLQKHIYPNINTYM